MSDFFQEEIVNNVKHWTDAKKDEDRDKANRFSIEKTIERASI